MHFKNTTNISRTSFDRDKSFQINVVYRIDIEKSKIVQLIREKYENKYFLQPPRCNFFFDTQSGGKIFFFLALSLNVLMKVICFLK